MSFKRKSGKTKIMYFPKTASTAFSVNSLVTFSSGLLIPAVAASSNIVGVIQRAVASSDDDYADTSLVPVEVPVELNVEFEFDADSGLVSTDLGAYKDLIDASTVDGDDNSSAKQIVVTKYISATKGWGILNQLFGVRGS